MMMHRSAAVHGDVQLHHLSECYYSFIPAAALLAPERSPAVCSNSKTTTSTTTTVVISADQSNSQPSKQSIDHSIMSKLSLLLSLLAGSASAFAPASKQTVRTDSSLQAFEDEIGAQPPLGFFDPLGLLNDADADRFNRLRYVEIKHGRVCMLAVLGHIVTTGGVRLPGDIDYHGTSFASIPTGIAALSKVPAAGLLQIFLFIGFLELGVMKDITGDGEFVGDFRNDYIDFGWDTFTPEEKERKRAIELNNGRAAQMGILGLMVHEMLPTHDPYMINGLLGAPINFNAGF